jgi:predicted nucleic acid-binding protein
MNVVDSSAWLEYFVGGKSASNFVKPIEDTKKLIVPSISILEVFKKVLSTRGEDDALQAVALMQQGRVVELSVSIALLAGKLGVLHKLPMADSIILATAKQWKATLWTLDSDFIGLEGVRFFKKVL